MPDDCCPPTPSGSAAGTRQAFIRLALRLEWLTLAWLTIEAAVAIASGVMAHSISLTAFGIDSLIELASAGVLMWRLRVELARGDAFSEYAERRASRIAGGLLYALALYVVAAAAWSLWQREGEMFSWPVLIVTALAIPIMYSLATGKRAVAAELGSRALRADAAEAIACGWLSFVVLVGLLAQLALGAWWIDAATSLAILWFLLKEAREAWIGES